MDYMVGSTAPDEDGCVVSIARGKRTKRQRLQIPLAAVAVEAAVSPAFSAQFSRSTTTTDEEDMANCLILLARGCSPKPEPNIFIEESKTAMKLRCRRFAEPPTDSSGTAGFYAFECKTCNKCFSSFQALGGHRASHKKPMLSILSPTPTADEEKTAVKNGGRVQLNMHRSWSVHALTSSADGGRNGKPRIHDCSICGAEFASGQALGGHMRRHRPACFQEQPPPEAKKARTGFSLDLNLPAPSEDDERSTSNLPKSSTDSFSSTTAFYFANKPPLLLTASALVDCHY